MAMVLLMLFEILLFFELFLYNCYKRKVKVHIGYRSQIRKNRWACSLKSRFFNQCSIISSRDCKETYNKINTTSMFYKDYTPFSVQCIIREILKIYICRRGQKRDINTSRLLTKADYTLIVAFDVQNDWKLKRLFNKLKQFILVYAMVRHGVK